MATALAAAPELAQAYLLQLAGGLHPIAAFAARAVGPRWALVPAYAAAFLQLFALAQLFWRHIAGVRDARKAALLASCVLSTAHGSLTTLASLAIARPWVAAARAAAPAGGAWWAALALDGASSAAELRLTQFTLAYLLADTAFMLLWTPNDRALITHHALAATYFFIIHALGVGGVTVAFTLALGECTAPLLNAFTVAKELRGERAWAAAAFPALSMAFTVAFVGLRSVLFPPAVAYFVYRLVAASPGIPPVWSYALALQVTLGMVGSQLWSYKLIVGARKHKAKRRASREAAKAD